jgi:hypothetical protein
VRYDVQQVLNSSPVMTPGSADPATAKRVLEQRVARENAIADFGEIRLEVFLEKMF